MSRNWLITGVSSGFGRSLAQEVLRRGDTVVGTLRKPEQAAAFTALEPGRSFAELLDVTAGPEAVERAVESAIGQVGHLDVVVNNAGYGLTGALEEVSDAESRAIMDTNYFGALHVCQAVLPHFRGRGSGHIVNISSVAGIIGWAGNGAYAASKFALEGMSETLRNEVKGFGVQVTLVEPGLFKTDWFGRSLVKAQKRMPDYDDVLDRRDVDVHHENVRAGDPDAAARAICLVVEAERPPLRLPLGEDAVAVVDLQLGLKAKELARWREVALDVYPEAGG
ncbi:MAG: short-chain dehydrogenase/reductase [Frankiales bacterium]|nr:short-chain dehydrogenase/reductase [Frankiales bacterium]